MINELGVCLCISVVSAGSTMIMINGPIIRMPVTIYDCESSGPSLVSQVPLRCKIGEMGSDEFFSSRGMVSSYAVMCYLNSTKCDYENSLLVSLLTLTRGNIKCTQTITELSYESCRESCSAKHATELKSREDIAGSERGEHTVKVCNIIYAGFELSSSRLVYPYPTNCLYYSGYCTDFKGFWSIGWTVNESWIIL